MFGHERELKNLDSLIVEIWSRDFWNAKQEC